MQVVIQRVPGTRPIGRLDILEHDVDVTGFGTGVFDDTFVAVARAASFTQAGEVLGISKSAVGKAVTRLEGRQGVKLFHRTTRRLALTADGEAYFAVCARALEGIAEAEGSLGSKLLVPAGRLRIDMPAAFGAR